MSAPRAAPAVAPEVDLAPSERAGLGVGLDAMPAGRRAVLSVLKERGEASAEEVAAQLGVTAGAVRQHLGTLEAEGLVAYRDERPGPGRPRRRYCLAPAAEALWPKRYGQLTNDVLGFLAETDPALIGHVFERRRGQRVARALARLADRTFDEQVQELTAILDDDGYLATAERHDDGSWLIVEHNCAILDVALRYGAACSSELEFLRQAMPGTEIERIAHMVAGGHRCAYEVRPATAVCRAR